MNPDTSCHMPDVTELEGTLQGWGRAFSRLGQMCRKPPAEPHAHTVLTVPSTCLQSRVKKCRQGHMPGVSQACPTRWPPARGTDASSQQMCVTASQAGAGPKVPGFRDLIAHTQPFLGTCAAVSCWGMRVSLIRGGCPEHLHGHCTTPW